MKFTKSVCILLLFSLLNLSLQTCEIQSLTMQVENLNLGSNYNLYLNLGSPDRCQYKCVFSPKVANSQELTAATPNKPDNMMTFYKFKFEGLENYKEYTFTCSTDTYTSQRYTIKFPHSKDKIKLLAFGDWGDKARNSSPKAQQNYGPFTLEYLKKRSDDDAILFAGDLAYNLHNLQETNKKTQKDHGKTGDDWLNKIMPITILSPFQMIWGNHEAMEKDRTYPNYFGRFSFPQQNGDPEGNGNWYSFNIGKDIHVLTLNNNILADHYAKGVFTGLKDKLKNWMTQDLSNNKSKWTILYLHNPLYCSYKQKGGDGRCSTSAEAVRSFLEEEVGIVGKVDVVVTGHVHTYERYHPMDKGAQVGTAPNDNVYLNPEAPINVVCGNAGQSEGVGEVDPTKVKPGSAKISGNPGVCEIIISGDKLTFNMIGGERDNTNSDFTIQDTFTIKKDRPSLLKRATTYLRKKVVGSSK